MKKSGKRSSPRFFILITSDAHKTLRSSLSAYQLALQRLKDGTWGFNERTKNRKAIEKGDRVIVYASGQRENGMTFVGTARVATPPRPLATKERMSAFKSVGQVGEIYAYYANLEKVDVFNTPVPIRPLISQLSFIKEPNAKWWALPLVGGSLAITERDFYILCTQSKTVGKN
jgi:predicted RNA-binding protein